MFQLSRVALCAVLLHTPTAFGSVGPRQDDGAYAVQKPPLDTPWTYNIGTNPWPEFPNPLLERTAWKNLNGLWRYQDAGSLEAVENPPFDTKLRKEVLVPSCLESGLSGIQGENTFYSWFSTSFEVPPSFNGQRTLLKFGAVDYEATVFVNGKKVGFNRGGYAAFSIDITDSLKSGLNNLLVFVHDPTDSGDYVIPIGKQTLRPSHIFYRPCSGIWQSVWIEAAPEEHIVNFTLAASADGHVRATIFTTAEDNCTDVEIRIVQRGSNQEVARVVGLPSVELSFHTTASIQPWTPDSPNLYDVYFQFGEDTVRSYTAFRTITRKNVGGAERILLNGEVIFPFGPLDQGYWPDGLHTPPNREALEFDLKTVKSLNMNMVRKHIKVESALYYESCDRLGVLVMQDMPSPRPLQGILPNAEQQKEFERQLELMVTQLRNHPSIFAWTIYNEGWGQITDYFPEIALTDRLRAIDPTRLINSVSGWFDHGAGDFIDNHHYASPECGTPFNSEPTAPYDPARIGYQGEFGGVGHNVTIDHLWNVEAAIRDIPATYELRDTIPEWNARGHELMTELLSQVDRYACSGGVWTQTTDVEGEVNGFLTYDRRILRNDVSQWQADVSALYKAIAARVKG